MIITIIWLVGWVLAVWPIWNLLFGGDDMTDRGEVIATGGIVVLISLFWPAILIGWGMWRASRAAWDRILVDRDKEQV